MQRLLKRLPGGLVEATSLEVTGVRGCRSLELHKADATVLRRLKGLHRLEVNDRQDRGVATFLRKQLPCLEVVDEREGAWPGFETFYRLLCVDGVFTV